MLDASLSRCSKEEISAQNTTRHWRDHCGTKILSNNMKFIGTGIANARVWPRPTPELEVAYTTSAAASAEARWLNPMDAFCALWMDLPIMWFKDVLLEDVWRLVASVRRRQLSGQMQPSFFGQYRSGDQLLGIQETMTSLIWRFMCKLNLQQDASAKFVHQQGIWVILLPPATTVSHIKVCWFHALSMFQRIDWVRAPSEETVIT